MDEDESDDCDASGMVPWTREAQEAYGLNARRGDDRSAGLYLVTCIDLYIKHVAQTVDVC